MRTSACYTADRCVASLVDELLRFHTAPGCRLMPLALPQTWCRGTGTGTAARALPHRAYSGDLGVLW
jgi:hypothetical protein